MLSVIEQSIMCFVIMSLCNFASKGRHQNGIYCVWWDVKPYLLTHSLHHG